MFDWIMSLNMVNVRRHLITNHNSRFTSISCRAVTAENRVEEVMPSGGAFLGDSSMKYVRITSTLGYDYPLQ
jgi:hypothetical protein